MLLRVNEQRNIVHEKRKRKANWIGHILRRNCLLKQVIEGKIKGEMDVARRRGRRRKKLLDDLKDRRGYSHLKEEALDRTNWRHRFGGGFGPVVRQNTEWMNIIMSFPAKTAMYVWPGHSAATVTDNWTDTSWQTTLIRENNDPLVDNIHAGSHLFQHTVCSIWTLIIF